MANPILEAAIAYADRGWPVVPLRPKDKIPWLPEWQIKATIDSEVVAEWWNGRPKSNVGIQLGERSGLIDIEGDEADSEKEILALFGGKIPHCPTFSSHRSIHRIFRWNNRLPGGAVVHIGAVEIRTGNHSKGAQTVFPPSVHPSGDLYRWLDGFSPDDCEPPELPDATLARIYNSAGEDTAIAPEEHTAKAWTDLYEDGGVCEGGRDNALLSEACKHAKRIPNIEDPQEQAQLSQLLKAMNATMCRPPLPPKDVQRILGQAINYTRGDQTKAARDNVGHTELGLQHDTGIWTPGDWQLTIIASDPPEYRLHVPAWEELTSDGSGTVGFDVDEFRDPNAVAAKVMATTKTIVLDDTPKKWLNIWRGDPGNKREKRPAKQGLMAKLIGEAKLEEAPAVEKRYVVVAEIFQEMIVDRARIAREEDKPNRSGVTEMSDKTLWFRWREEWSEPIRDRLVTYREPPELRRRLKITEKDFRLVRTGETGRQRYCVLQMAHIKALDDIIASGSGQRAQ